MPTFQTEAMKSKAAEVWSRLLGCFGDSVIRKFGKDVPAEWVTGIWMLQPRQIDRAFRRMNYQGLTAPPTLPAFMRLARGIGDENDPDAPPPPLPQLTGPAMDAWEAQASFWLLTHIRNEIAKAPRKYGQPASWKGMGVSRKDSPNADAPDAFVSAVKHLVAAKKAWAADMRDLGQNDAQGRVPMDLAKATWADYIQFAEKQILAAQQAAFAPRLSADAPSKASGGPA